jgi:pyruvate dehydrogenase kinase 2/3/4
MAKNSTDTNSNTASSPPVKISMDELLALASCHPTPLSLKAMYEYAPKKASKKLAAAAPNKNKYVNVDRLRNSQFLHRELPIRVAQRAIDLLTLPYGLNRTKEVQSVANTYLQYLAAIRNSPFPTNAESDRAFTDVLKSFILDRHSIPMAIAKGLQSLEDNRRAPMDMRRLAEMEEALSRFFTARVGLRFLVEHHVLTGNEENSDSLYRAQLEAEGGLDMLEKEPLTVPPSEEEYGCIQKDCDPVKEVKRTAARVAKLCRESYGIAPEIEVVDCTRKVDVNVPFTYVPHHLRYMVAELLKNSCRATVRR